ncbi:DUF1571 domain-containing protein [Tundrisphaera sp. TA3]|uniref:DUF1571 domain-containing protein n=1 Tax=Tundrisphaera sp. TA3 TaxID=3435775 RepID=UPI003EB7B082
MFPAMDRSCPFIPGRRRLALGVALGLVPILIAPGCARMRSSRSAPAPATLGVERPENNYSSYHTARNTANSPVVDSTIPHIAGVEAIPPGEMIVEANPPAVTPAPGPASDESTHLVSATRGVPNAARLIAASGARPESPAPALPTDEAVRLLEQARASLNRASSYQAKMYRQERVGSKLLPAEDLVLSVRREPLAVRLSWPEGPTKGREVIYRADSGGGLIHVNMADSAIPVPRISLPPDNPMVMRNSRHPITEAGFDSIIAAMERAVASPGPAPLTFAGMETPVSMDRPHPCLVFTNAAGEVAKTYLDPDSHLPVVVEVKAANGDLLEDYRFHDVRIDVPELAQADAFDQDVRWGPARGLFGRIARGNDATDEAKPR